MRCFMLVVLALLAIAFTADARAEEDAAVHQAGKDRVSVNAIDLNIQRILVEAGEAVEADFALDQDVRGSCTAFLYDLSFAQMLDILLPHADARWYKKRGVIHIVSRERFEALQEDGEAPAAAPDEGGERPAEGAGQDAVAVRDNPEDKLTLSVRNLPVAQTLQLLSIQNQRNIVVSEYVGGPVTVQLSDVTFDQALDHILSVNGWHRIDRENYIWVVTRQEWEAMQDERGRAEE